MKTLKNPYLEAARMELANRPYLLTSGVKRAI